MKDPFNSPGANSSFRPISLTGALKEPCVECPFRRTALPGWLGDHKTSQEIIEMIRFDGFFPCHMKVTALADRIAWEEAVVRAPHCAGALAFMNNTHKLSRDPGTAFLQGLMGKRDDCFASDAEMREHHGR